MSDNFFNTFLEKFAQEDEERKRNPPLIGGKTFPELVNLIKQLNEELASERENVTRAQEIIRILAEKIPKPKEDSEHTKNGSPSPQLKSIKPQK